MKPNKKQLPKIIVIVGPTSSGKSDLAVKIARKYNGEIISADSRQVYGGLDIGTGKITKKEMFGVPHYMLDVASVKETYSVYEFSKTAEKIIRLILLTEKIPIVVGGTGFWIDTLIGNISLPNVSKNSSLRKNLEKKSVEELFKTLLLIDRARSKTIDRKNPRRLIRAIEIALALGRVPRHIPKEKYNPLFIGIGITDKKLKKKISERTKKMLRAGLVLETLRLKKLGISDKRIFELGFEYSTPLSYINKNITKKELFEIINAKTWKYVKRQKQWFKKNEKIHWIVSQKESDKLILSFLEKTEYKDAYKK